MKITPMLWFDDRAEEAARFYVEIFPNSKIDSVSRYGEGMPKPAGSAMVVAFALDGNDFTALNGGPQFKFSEAISFVVPCRDQREIDHYWDKLSAGGAPGQCGWLKDRFGVSWQIIPEGIGELIKHPRALQAMMQMKKLDVQRLRDAAKG
jgi:predicted 3-demethylubiquinone-9 3-methyltransferase (glyoxalase superfamily)